MNKLVLLAFLLFGIVSTAAAHSYSKGSIEIGHIWARATSVGMTTGAIYFPLLNKGETPDTFLGAKSPIADKIELHESTNMNQMATMKRLDSVALPPHEPIALRPGGIHLMVIGLKKQLKKGETMPLTLYFDKAGSINVEALIEGPGAMSGAMSDAP